MNKKSQQFTCPKCGDVGASAYSRHYVEQNEFGVKRPLCRNCNYNVEMLPSHNGKILSSEFGTRNMQSLLIWWTDQKQCESVGKELLDSLPDYIQNELDSRIGRPGRGRLFIHEELPKVSVDPWPETDLAKTLLNSAGIVFKSDDLDKMSSVPGIITDLNLLDIRESGHDTDQTYQFEMVKIFQCPGCSAGTDPESGCFKPSDDLSCRNHSAGTYGSGIGCINIGLPKGFNRLGPIDKSIQKSNIRISLELPQYNSFNMPLWALEQDGYLFIVTALPRLQQFWVDIVPNKKISDLPPYVIDVSTIDLNNCV